MTDSIKPFSRKTKIIMQEGPTIYGRIEELGTGGLTVIQLDGSRQFLPYGQVKKVVQEAEE